MDEFRTTLINILYLYSCTSLCFFVFTHEHYVRFAKTLLQLNSWDSGWQGRWIHRKQPLKFIIRGRIKQSRIFIFCRSLGDVILENWKKLTKITFEVAWYVDVKLVDWSLQGSRVISPKRQDCFRRKPLELAMGGPGKILATQTNKEQRSPWSNDFTIELNPQFGEGFFSPIFRWVFPRFVGEILWLIWPDEESVEKGWSWRCH